MAFFKSKFPMFVAFGAGLLVGGSISFLYAKYTARLLQELARLSVAVAELRKELADWKAGQPASKKTGYYSVQASSGDDDDDEFEEAYGGGSEYDSARTSLTSTSSEFRLKKGSLSEELFNDIDQLLEGSVENKERAYRILESAKKKLSSNPEFLWRFSRASYLLSGIEGRRGNEEMKKKYLYAANDYATSALHHNADCPDAHKWIAVTLGIIGEYEGTQEKIRNGYKIREHIEKAIELKPNDPTMHYMLGRWCYGVYMLTWLERQLAATLFAAPPTSTVEEALSHFLQAERLKPDRWQENMLYIARCYIEQRRYAEAVQWLDSASAVDEIDSSVQSEVDTLLTKFSNYRR